MFRRALPGESSRRVLERLANRLVKIVAQARNLKSP